MDPDTYSCWTAGEACNVVYEPISIACENHAWCDIVVRYCIKTEADAKQFGVTHGSKTCYQEEVKHF